MTTEEKDPTTEEIMRVGRYWARVKARACSHSSGITFDVDNEMRCPDCDQRLFVMSEMQIEELRKEKQ
jgi:DNA-directed RNA polymerase subunit RPC12/RpoP